MDPASFTSPLAFSQQGLFPMAIQLAKRLRASTSLWDVSVRFQRKRHGSVWYYVWIYIYIYIYNYIYIYIYIYICVSQSTFCENMTTSKHVDFPANSTIFLSQLAVPSLLRAGDVFRVYGSADLPMNQRVANLGLSLKTFWSKKRSTKMPVLSKNHQNHHVKYGKNRNHEKYRISRHVIIFLPVQPVFFLSEQRFPMENTDTAWASFSVLPRVVQSL